MGCRPRHLQLSACPLANCPGTTIDGPTKTGPLAGKYNTFSCASSRPCPARGYLSARTCHFSFPALILPPFTCALRQVGCARWSRRSWHVFETEFIPPLVASSSSSHSRYHFLLPCSYLQTALPLVFSTVPDLSRCHRFGAYCSWQPASLLCRLLATRLADQR